MQGCRAAPRRMHRPKSIPFLRFVLIIFFPEVLMVDKMTDRQTGLKQDIVAVVSYIENRKTDRQDRQNNIRSDIVPATDITIPSSVTN